MLTADLLPGDRYHYNVSTARLDVHVNKGRADGLHVSSVGSSGDLWAVIMDAGTQFTAQVGALLHPGPCQPNILHAGHGKMGAAFVARQ